jgi:hypothetical protein
MRAMIAPLVPAIGIRKAIVRYARINGSTTTTIVEPVREIGIRKTTVHNVWAIGTNPKTAICVKSNGSTTTTIVELVRESGIQLTTVHNAWAIGKKQKIARIVPTTGSMKAIIVEPVREGGPLNQIAVTVSPRIPATPVRRSCPVP